MHETCIFTSGHCVGTVWALCGHCVGTVWALSGFQDAKASASDGLLMRGEEQNSRYTRFNYVMLRQMRLFFGNGWPDAIVFCTR